MSEMMNNTSRPVTAADIAAALHMSVNTVRVYLGENNLTRGRKNSPSVCRVRNYAASVGYDPKAAYAYNRAHITENKARAKAVSIETFYYGGNFHSKAEEKAKMQSLRDAGYSHAEIARKIGRCYETVLNNLGPQDPTLTLQNHRLAFQYRAQKNAARAQYLRNKPIAEYNAKVQEHNELKAKLNALQVELLTEKPQIEQTAKITVTAPQMNLVNLQPTALN